MKIGMIVAGVLISVGTAAAQLPPCTAVPGWTQQGPARSFAPDNLFDYMNGMCVFRKENFVGGFANLPSGHDGVAETEKLAASVK